MKRKEYDIFELVEQNSFEFEEWRWPTPTLSLNSFAIELKLTEESIG